MLKYFYFRISSSQAAKKKEEKTKVISAISKPLFKFTRRSLPHLLSFLQTRAGIERLRLCELILDLARCEHHPTGTPTCTVRITETRAKSTLMTRKSQPGRTERVAAGKKGPAVKLPYLGVLFFRRRSLLLPLLLGAGGLVVVVLLLLLLLLLLHILAV